MQLWILPHTLLVCVVISRRQKGRRLTSLLLYSHDQTLTPGMSVCSNELDGAAYVVASVACFLIVFIYIHMKTSVNLLLKPNQN